GEAGDLTQETFTRAFASLENLDAERSPAPWLYSVARNLCVDHLRKKRDAAESLPDDAVSDRSDCPEREDDRRSIAAAIEDLPPSDRELCYLYYFEELSVKDIGLLVGRPAGTVKYRMFRIRAMLRKRLEDVGEG
ncbi:MAG: sigma-70 family RNA polymerase sigma factor, partial [Treponemataceae bacterium]